LAGILIVNENHEKIDVGGTIKKGPPECYTNGPFTVPGVCPNCARQGQLVAKSSNRNQK
jgi:hypothetical protein